MPGTKYKSSQLSDTSLRIAKDYRGDSASREYLKEVDPTQVGYTAEFPSPWWPLGVLTSAHINKLMIIAKGENHTQNTQANRKDKLK